MQTKDDLNYALEVAQELSTVDKVRLMEQVMATLRDDLQPKTPKPSLYGIWSDVSISDADIDDARDDM